MGMNKNTVLGWATFYNDSNGIILIGLGALNIETFCWVFASWCWIFWQTHGF
jgi:hypothetical protein